MEDCIELLKDHFSEGKSDKLGKHLKVEIGQNISKKKKREVLLKGLHEYVDEEFVKKHILNLAAQKKILFLQVNNPLN